MGFERAISCCDVKNKHGGQCNAIHIVRWARPWGSDWDGILISLDWQEVVFGLDFTCVFFLHRDLCILQCFAVCTIRMFSLGRFSMNGIFSMLVLSISIFIIIPNHIDVVYFCGCGHRRLTEVTSISKLFTCCIPQERPAENQQLAASPTILAWFP